MKIDLGRPRYIALPALLWSAHFLIVYIYVSYACLWGLPAIPAVVVGVTVPFVAAMVWMGVHLWRRRPSGAGRRFVVAGIAGQSFFFAAATVATAFPSLWIAPCFG